MPTNPTTKDNKAGHNTQTALDSQGRPVHISEVASGRNGYYCPGCKQEKEARKSKVQKSYFAHVAKDVNAPARPCAYTDETYRHEVSKQILQRLKRVKVPKLIKYPPPGVDGYPVILAKESMVEAHSVIIERYFYEDDEGNIRYETKREFEKIPGKNWLIKPDVIFLNKQGQPILFIEIVATHKVKADKLIKLRQLYVDTIEIEIPVAPVAEIEKYFTNRTGRTEWLFNRKLEETDYEAISFSQRHYPGVSPGDRFSRAVFEANGSFECQQSQLNNLIRRIRKYLRTDEYRRAEAAVGRQLERMQAIEAKYRAQWEGIQGSIGRQLQAGFEQTGREISKRQSILDRRISEKARALELEERTYRAGCQDEIERLENEIAALEGELSAKGIDYESVEGVRAEFGEKERRMDEFYRAEKERMEREIGIIEREIEAAVRNIGAKQRDREEMPGRFAMLGAHAEEQFRKAKVQIERAFEEEGRRMAAAAAAARGEVIRAIEDRDSQGNGPIFRGIRDALQARQVSLDLQKARSCLRRLRKAKEVFDSRAYKDWG